VLTHVCILGAIATTDAYEHSPFVQSQSDVIENGVNEFINRYDIGCIQDKRGSEGSLPKNKQQMIEYDREPTSKCVQLDLFCPSPRIDDRQFELRLHLKRSMVVSILCNIANYNSF